MKLYHGSDIQVQEQALDAVYNSNTFRNIQNTATGLYYQSVGYVYDDLQKELKIRA